MNKFKQYMIVSVSVIFAYGLIALPVQLVEAIDLTRESRVIEVEDEIVGGGGTTALEPSRALESLDNIPEVTVQWEELEALVEDSEGSGEVLEDLEIEEAEESEKDCEIVDSVQYFDVPLSEDLQDYIFGQCESVGIEPEIIIAMIEKESTYEADVIGDNGRAFGLMQIHPRWHSWRMEELGCTDLLDPFDNVTVGIDILAELIEIGAAEGKSIEWALMAYNGGEDYADSLISEGQISEYASDVMNIADGLEVIR